MKKYIIWLLSLVTGIPIYAQNNVNILSAVPAVDGKLDEFLSPAMLRQFPEVHKSRDELAGINVSYFLGYTRQYFYLYIETASDSIIIRDRAYQNGDGFHLTIGLAKDDGSDTDEFYVFGFSPSTDWTRKIEWYHNIDLSMKRLSEEVMFETSEGKDKSGFELLIPWESMNPLHPWLTGNIAFNLCFVKAVNEKDKIYNFLKVDERMQSELSKRKYVNLTFENPVRYSGYTVSPERNNLTAGDTLVLEIAGYAAEQENKSYNVELHVRENMAYSEVFELHLEQGYNRISVKLKAPFSEAGIYTVKVYDGAGLLGKDEVSVFENINLQEVRNSLDNYKPETATGTYYTLLFHLNELEHELTDLREYEASPSVAVKIEELNSNLSQLSQKKDLVANRKGRLRRAFMSELDQTLQPYSIYVPDDYTPEKPYPLLVYLHGSGQDDRALFTSSFIQDGFIVLAPNGRGTSNCFSTAEALTDIREAIDDVEKNYNVAHDKRILSGFSMGGYGVYRLFYEYPNLFCAVAIFSGHPDLARKWGIPNPVNFLDEQIVSEFAGVPVFIYHGQKDLNCPYSLTLDFVNLLKQYNRQVAFYTDENAGHNAINEEIRKAYFHWLGARVAD